MINEYVLLVSVYNNIERVLVSIHTDLCLLLRKSKHYNQTEIKMWDIGGDKWDLFEVANLF